MSSPTTYIVSQTWDGARCTPEEEIACTLQCTDDTLIFEFQAPFHNDPPPPDSSPQSLWGLWDFEVVELFLVGADGEYLEAEFGPHGHHLLLWLLMLFRAFDLLGNVLDLPLILLLTFSIRFRIILINHV